MQITALTVEDLHRLVFPGASVLSNDTDSSLEMREAVSRNGMVTYPESRNLMAESAKFGY
jgi:hypothetical protein